MAFTENIAAFFRAGDFAVAAVFGGTTAQVILDRPDVEMMAGRVQGTEYLMAYNAADLPNLAEGDTGTVDGTSYTVREIRATDDGKIKQATLEANA